MICWTIALTHTYTWFQYLNRIIIARESDILTELRPRWSLKIIQFPCPRSMSEQCRSQSAFTKICMLFLIIYRAYDSKQHNLGVKRPFRIRICVNITNRAFLEKRITCSFVIRMGFRWSHFTERFIWPEYFPLPNDRRRSNDVTGVKRALYSRSRYRPTVRSGCDPQSRVLCIRVRIVNFVGKPIEIERQLQLLRTQLSDVLRENRARYSRRIRFFSRHAIRTLPVFQSCCRRILSRRQLIIVVRARI